MLLCQAPRLVDYLRRAYDSRDRRCPNLPSTLADKTPLRLFLKLKDHGKENGSTLMEANMQMDDSNLGAFCP